MLRLQVNQYDLEFGAEFELVFGTDFSSSYQELNKFSHYRTKRELIVSYLKISVEGDLAGFQIAWLMMSLGFLILKIFNITDVIKTIQWWAIFVIPIFNALLTAWLDYIIRKYRSTRTIESLAKSRFIVLWAIKVIFVIYVTTYWIWGRGSFMVRAKQLHSFQGIYTYKTYRKIAYI